MHRTFALPLALITAAAISGCAGMKPASKTFSQEGLPTAVQVPAGHRVAMETVGVGQITYECRTKANAADQFEWFFVGPKAELRDRNGMKVGTYYGPPASWESQDGSKVTGAQVAVAPSSPANLPLQLVKANPATGQGAMSGLTYIQRVATRGGVPPSSACDASAKGRQEVVQYQADYILWKAV